MSMLQKKWIHDKNHEAIRVKILVVIERLLDRAIMGANVCDARLRARSEHYLSGWL